MTLRYKSYDGESSTERDARTLPASYVDVLVKAPYWVIKMMIVGRISPSTNKRPKLPTPIRMRVRSERELLLTMTYEGTQTELQNSRLLEYFAVLKEIRHGDGVDG